MSGFADLMARFTGAVCTGDAAAAAACFTDEGAYHDVFYGTFRGRAAIVDMIENHFYRDGEELRWDMFDPVSDGKTGYVRYIFSTKVKTTGQRSIFEGIVCARLKDGLFDDYDEVANTAPGLSMSGAPDATLLRFSTRQAAALRARGEAARHL